jgi:hypothetical protein
MSITLGTLTLPDALVWTNRSALAAVSQAAKRRLDGGIAVYARPLFAGRSIELKIPEDVCITRADQMALETLASTAGAIHALAIPNEGLAVQVQFDWRNGDALALSPLFDYQDPAAEDFVYGTLKLLTV